MKLKRYSLAEQAYQSLMKQIISGERKAGEKLTEDGLCHLFGISRTPAREALVKLDRDGLVERLPRNGWRISIPSRQQVCQMFECRREIECLALRRAFGRIPVSELTELKELLLDSNQDLKERSFAADEQFHGLVADYCGNDYLKEILNRLRRQTAPYRFFRTDCFAPDELLQERLALVEAVLSGDIEDAVSKLSEHITSGVRMFAENSHSDK